MTAIATATWPRPEVLPPVDEHLLVVEASAGTGKTYFLEHRVVDLVLSGAPLEQILVVTFTDKATAELRTRIRDLVDRISRASSYDASGSHWVIDDTARDRLAAALAGFDHAPIFTIHGFCHRVLIEDAFAARRLFEQTRIADEIAFDDAFATVLREDYARDPQHAALLGAYLERGRTVAQLHELLLRCARADAPVRRHVDLARVVPLARALLAELGDDAARARFLGRLALAGQNKRWVPTWVDELGRGLASVDPEAPPARVLGALDALREVASKIADKLAVLTIPPAAVAAADAITALATAAPIETAIASAFLPIVLARLGADKAEHGLFDYADMLRLVADALAGPRGSALAARLRARTPWALIDEFQDTDAVQWDIFRTVWLAPEAKGLAIVGDPKQAIYSFRGADVTTYLEARDALLAAGARRVALTVNRRSTPELVDAVNALLAGDGINTLFVGPITYDEPVTAGGSVTCAGGRAPITVFALQTAVKPLIDPQRGALAEAIGAEIERLRAAPPAWQRGGVPAALGLRDMMVLTRTNSEASEIAASLRARGLACALVESDRLFDTREAADLAAVLSAIAAPRDRSARLRALRSRFFDVPWAQLTAVADAPDDHPAIAQLYEWSALAARRAYEQLFRRLIEDSRFAERAIVLGGGERAITNTWHVIELLLEEVARSRSNLHELVTRLRGWIADRADRTDERDTQRAETDADAIRVLTVHKAKGLEAPCVFLYGMSGAPPPSNVHTIRDPGGRAVLIGNDDEAGKTQLRREQAEENQRLAYVALTRAQIRLYLPSYTVKLIATSAYKPIQGCLEPLLGGRAPETIKRHFEVVPVDVDVGAPPVAPPDALLQLDAPAPPVTPPLVPIAGARAGLTLISYTRLAHDVDTAARALHAAATVVADELGPDELGGEGDGPRASAIAVVGADELPSGAASGLLLHDVLERADLDIARAAPDAAAWATDPVVTELLATCARDRGIAPGYLPHAAVLAHRALTAPLELDDSTQLPPLVAATRIAREVEFAFPYGAGARGLVKGYLDALVAYDDELWVVDYKSDLLPAADRAAAGRRVDDRYLIQARLYLLAAQRLAGPRRLAGMLFAFIRHGITVPVRADAESLAAWAAWLGGVDLSASPSGGAAGRGQAATGGGAA